MPIERQHPALKRIVSPGQAVEKLASGFGNDLGPAEGPLGACPRKKPLKNNALELRGGDLKISHFPETRVLTGDQNFLIFSKNT